MFSVLVRAYERPVRYSTVVNRTGDSRTKTCSTVINVPIGSERKISSAPPGTVTWTQASTAGRIRIDLAITLSYH